MYYFLRDTLTIYWGMGHLRPDTLLVRMETAGCNYLRARHLLALLKASRLQCMCFEWSSGGACPTRAYLIVETPGIVTSKRLRQWLY
jgi:hypothetical protein